MPDERNALVEEIHKVLRDWNLSTLAQEDDPTLPYPLVDAVSRPGGSIASGEDELGEIAAAVARLIPYRKG